MKEKTNTGGPAFPCQEIEVNYTSEPLREGMTLRDYFASKAMQGLVISSDSLEAYFHESEITTRDEMTSKFSEIAYDFADAMLEARDEN